MRTKGADGPTTLIFQHVQGSTNYGNFSPLSGRVPDVQQKSKSLVVISGSDGKVKDYTQSSNRVNQLSHKEMKSIYVRRLGPDPHKNGAQTRPVRGCPDIFELESGDFSIIGSDITSTEEQLRASASCGLDERIVRIPRKTLLLAKSDNQIAFDVVRSGVALIQYSGMFPRFAAHWLDLLQSFGIVASLLFSSLSFRALLPVVFRTPSR